MPLDACTMTPEQRELRHRDDSSNIRGLRQ